MKVTQYILVLKIVDQVRFETVFYVLTKMFLDISPSGYKISKRLKQRVQLFITLHLHSCSETRFIFSALAPYGLTVWHWGFQDAFCFACLHFLLISINKSLYGRNHTDRYLLLRINILEIVSDAHIVFHRIKAFVMHLELFDNFFL